MVQLNRRRVLKAVAEPPMLHLEILVGNPLAIHRCKSVVGPGFLVNCMGFGAEAAVERQLVGRASVDGREDAPIV